MLLNTLIIISIVAVKLKFKYNKSSCGNTTEASVVLFKIQYYVKATLFKFYCFILFYPALVYHHAVIFHYVFFLFNTSIPFLCNRSCM